MLLTVVFWCVSGRALYGLGSAWTSQRPANKVETSTDDTGEDHIMRVIFVPVADRPECARALRNAFNIGNQLGASVVGCHIRPHRYSSVSLPPEIDTLSPYDAAWESAWHGKKTLQSDTAARKLFSRTAARHGYPVIRSPRAEPGAIWIEKVGSPDKIMSIHGPLSDLVVVTKPAKSGGKLAQVFVMAALLNTGRPVLVIPHAGASSVGRRITIAWNQSNEAARAVAALMPLLQTADQVDIVWSGPEGGAGPKSGQLVNYLKFWGIKATRSKVSGPNEGQALLKAAKKSRSDLIVMGAYSRSRLRQRIFGGVTEFMLSRSDIPVCMLHS